MLFRSSNSGAGRTPWATSSRSNVATPGPQPGRRPKTGADTGDALIRPRLSRTAALAACLALAGCHAPEDPAAALARSRKFLLEGQLIELGRLMDKARRGELLTEGQIAIGVSESLVARLVAASLPPERVLVGRLRIGLEGVEPFFRGGLTAIGLRARVSSTDLPNARVDVEFGGSLRDVRLEKGRLTARIELVHFTVHSSFAGDLGKNFVEDAVRSNLSTVQGWIPPLEIPVLLEDAVDFGGLSNGPVRVGPGRLPLQLALSHVVPVNERLWLIVSAAAGEWESRPAAEAKRPR